MSELSRSRSLTSPGQRNRLLGPTSHRRASYVSSSHNSSILAAVTVVGTTLPAKISTAAPVKAERSVCELDPKNFLEFIAGDDLCVVDYYTGEPNKCASSRVRAVCAASSCVCTQKTEDILCLLLIDITLEDSYAGVPFMQTGADHVK